MPTTGELLLCALTVFIGGYFIALLSCDRPEPLKNERATLVSSFAAAGIFVLAAFLGRQKTTPGVC